ncbi:MAG: APC family permease [Candidatus Xenobia bacterium]
MSLLDTLLGKPLASEDEEEQRADVLSGIPMLGLDALSSAAYGPEAALTILIPLGAAGLHYMGPITAIILALLFILYLSYRQIIFAYPKGGGAYTVAHENLGVQAGLLAAASLLIDYVLNVAVGISAGVGALVSAVPSLHDHILVCCLIILALITLVNLRGVRESGMAFALPTYLFVVTLAGVLLIGVSKILASGGHPVPVEAVPVLPAAVAIPSLWILIRSFASGCTAMTGVEAVSNGVSAFREPSVKNAQSTLTIIIAILALLLAGLAWVATAYHIGAVDPDSPAYQSIISQVIVAVVGHNLFYYITIGGVLAVLALSANTSFAGFPRLCQLMARDDYLPRFFMMRGRRLVYSMGITILASMSAVILIAFGGVTDRLIPLFAVGAFGAFTLSQLGMVSHWRHLGGSQSQLPMFVNFFGGICTLIALGVVLVAKFAEGAWITVMVIPAAMLLFNRIHGHYAAIGKAIECSRPMQVGPVEPPIVIVPVPGWTTVVEKALRFGMQLSRDVKAVYVTEVDEESEDFRGKWEQLVNQPLAEAGHPPVELVVLQSPFRRLVQPLTTLIDELHEKYPHRITAVIIPELVEASWHQVLLHNQRATLLKAALLFRRDFRTVVVNVPWYFDHTKLPENGKPAARPPELMHWT